MHRLTRYTQTGFAPNSSFNFDISKMSFIKGFWRLLKRCWVLGYNRKKNIFGMNPLLISVIFIVFTSLLATLMRGTIRRCVSRPMLRQMLLEFTATAELCAVCFELVIVADNYGVWMYALFLFVLSIWWSRVWLFETACPYTELEKVVEGNQKLVPTLLVILAQLLGGIVVYYYVQLLWSFEMTETHRGKVNETCKADLQSPTSITLTELLGTFISTFPKRYLIKCYMPYAVVLCLLWDITFALLGKLFGCGPVYMNAAIATSFNWKCRTLRFVLLGYWISSNMGAVCAFVLIKIVNCRPILEVSPAIGTLIEGISTCMCRLASRLISDTETRFGYVADPFFATMMVVAAFNYSGGYFNPALATSLKAGCEGHTLVEFTVVYWFGACAGAIASIYIYNTQGFKQFVQRMKPKTA